MNGEEYKTMEKEFYFKLADHLNDDTIFKAVDITGTGLYRISWDNDEKYRVSVQRVVKNNIDNGNWIIL